MVWSLDLLFKNAINPLAEKNQRSNAGASEQCEKEPFLYQCFLCSFQTYKWEEFEQHCLMETEKPVKKEAECSLTSMSWGSSQVGLQKAMESKQSKGYQCSLCGYKAKCKPDVTKHMTVAHPERRNASRLTLSPTTAKDCVRPFVCSVCGYR